MELTAEQLALAMLGAFLVGLGKGGLPGVGNLTAAIYAMVFPAKASVGILLPVLIAADIVAVTVYRRHPAWGYLWRLLPWAFVGVLLGWLVMDHIDDDAVRLLIGIVLLGMTALHFGRKWWRKRQGDDGEDTFPHAWPFRAFTGILGGVATMVANAAGPVAALYFLAVGLPKLAFIGTTASFFFIVNIFKVPLQMELGIIHFDSIKLSLTLAPFAVAGALIAPRLVRYLKQDIFEALVWFFIIIAGVKLLIG